MGAPKKAVTKRHKKTGSKHTGRPTLYDPNYHPQAVFDFIDSCVDVPVKRVQSFSSGKMGESESYQLMERVKIPSVAGLAVYFKVGKSTLYQWKEEYPKFAESFEAMITVCEERIATNALSGHYNPTIAKLILASNHGYHGEKPTQGAVTIILPEAFANVIHTNTKTD